MKIATPILLTSIILLSLACASQNIKSTKIDVPVVVDGDGNDWEKFPLAFDEDFNFIYGALNTESDLYLMFRFNDNRLASMISSRGGTIWIGQNKHFGIHYINESMRDLMFNSSGRKPGQPDREERFQPAGTFSIVGNDSVWTPDMEQYPSLEADFKMNDGLYCFEIKIPFKHKDDIKILNKNPGDNIEIGFELAPIDENMKKQMDDQMKQRRGEKPEGMPPDGLPGGGRRGGGMRGGGQHSGNREMNFDAKEIWFEVTLVK